LVSFFVLNPTWTEVAITALNTAQVIILAWIARDVADAKSNRAWRDAREDRERAENGGRPT
jgi:hypothetical protein